MISSVFIISFSIKFFGLRSAPSDKVDLISFAANLGIFPAGDCVREIQIGQFSPEGVLMYVERGKLFKANRFSCIKKKTPDDFQRFHNIFFYKIFRFAVWTS